MKVLTFLMYPVLLTSILIVIYYFKINISKNKYLNKLFILKTLCIYEIILDDHYYV